ncbi:regulator of Ty1 Transposition [Coemansia spiralis]|uniref:Regulator of Ty1 Transposition n=2 Tax=Coemansia TaxID=4863 RepID=A0A9W8G7E4_9FUNG|nr:regulator of Ty1 Transposition [Coemansia umbellata]KAJ2623818.1 regulator of Ty1 Transposition [Coemansia sp. RSA 1358]KAJ2675283.1 regulator of Ty1 Transposition [Coemansia spiralis]
MTDSVLTNAHSAATVATEVQNPAIIRRLVTFSEVEQQNFVKKSDPVFDGVVYWINPVLGASECTRISQLLEYGGAKPATTRHHGGEISATNEDGLGHGRKLNGVLVRGLPQMINHISRFYLPSINGKNGHAHADKICRATHVISPDTHFGEYSACVKACVSVVTSQWVEQCLSVGWRYVERYYSPDAKNIFSGMIVAATHMPVADKETLLASVMALGGQWRDKMRPDVTHLIMMKEEGPKYEYVKKHPELGIKPILPHWFMDTLNLLCCFPLEPYLFPNPPRLLGKISKDAGKAADSAPNKQLDSSASSLAVPTADTHNGDAYELPKPITQFLCGYTVAICTQLRYSLSAGAISRLTQRLVEAGANVLEPKAPFSSHVDSAQEELPESLIDEWDSVDILLCQHRTGYDYSKASRLGKIVGTFVWLYQICLTGKITPPTQHLLHYPLPVAPVPNMEGMVISISHYTGASREYLRRLIIAMGAKYTPKLTRNNTHLITARSDGRKYSAAIEWNIDVVNHFWIEVCYQRWKLLSVSHPVFTYFPDLSILNSMVGDIEISVNRLRHWVDPPQGDTMAESSDMDILNDSDLDISAESHDSAAGSREVPIKTDREHIYEIPAQSVLLQGDDGDSADEAKSVSDSMDEMNANRTPEPLALGQIRHTSRAAAMAASRTLGEMMKAANIFETEMRKERLYKYRRGNTARRTLVLAEGENEQENNVAQTSGSDGMRVDEKENAKNKRGTQFEQYAQPTSSPRSVGNKRQRANTGTGGPKVRIMFTQVRPSADEGRRIIEMGGEIVEDATDATHLVATNIRRTLKMLMALASGRVCIVGRNWMEDSLAQGKWIPIDFSHVNAASSKYGLVDPEGERRWKVNMENAMQRAWKRRLLEGVTVLITPQAVPPLKTLKPLIEIAGGEAVESLPEPRLQSLVKSSCRVLNSSKDADDDLRLPLLLVTCKEDSHLWQDFQKHAPPGMRFPIYGTEVVLTGLLRQRLLHGSSEFAM